MATEKYARQGDLVIDKISPITKDWSTVENFVFAGDSSEHPHTLVGKAKIFKENLRTFLLLEEATEMVHGKPGGHKTTPMVAGSYEVRPLRERGNGLDRAVED